MPLHGFDYGDSMITGTFSTGGNSPESAQQSMVEKLGS